MGVWGEIVFGLCVGLLVRCDVTDAYQFCEDVHRNFKTPANSSLSFVPNPPGDLSYACDHGYTRISCCMVGYSSIQWYEWVPDRFIDDKFIPLMTDGVDARELTEDGQTLEIRGVERDRDGKMYKCVGHSDNHQPIENYVQLKIEECSASSVLLAPTGNTTTKSVLLREPVTLKCSLLGSADCDGKCIEWYKTKVYPNGTEYNPAILGGVEGYQQMENHPSNQTRSPGQVIDSLLVIERVNRSHLDWSYVCQAYAQPEKPKHVFRLEERALPEPEPYLHWVAVAAVGTAFIALLVAVLTHTYNVEIQIFYKTKIKRYPKIQDKEYHVFLLHTNECREDRVFALEVVRPYLMEDLDYRVFSEHDIEYGQDFLERHEEGLEKSCVLLVIISKQLLDDEPAKMCIRHAITIGMDVVYIVREHVDEPMESSRAIIASLRTGTKLVWLRDDEDKQVTTMTCTLCAPSKPDEAPCRPVHSVEHSRKKLQLYLLRLLEDHSRKGACVCTRHDPEHDLETHPFVTTSNSNVNIC